MKFWMGNFEALIADDTLAIKKDININRPGAPFFFAFATHFAFDFGDFLQHLARLHRSINHKYLIKEWVLVDITYGLRIVHMALLDDFAHALVNHGTGRGDVFATVTHIAAQGEIDVNIFFLMKWLHGAKVANIGRSSKCATIIATFARLFSKKTYVYMKNLAKLALAALIIGTCACNNIDQGLVQEMKQEATVLETVKVSTESAAQGVANLKNKIDALSAGEVKDGSTYMLKQINAKYNGMMERYNKAKAELEQLTTEYGSGKVKTEAVSQRFQQLKGEIESFENGFKRFQEITARPVEDLAKLGNEMAKSTGMSAAPDASKVSSDVGNTDTDSDAGATKAGTQPGSLIGDGAEKKKQ